MDTATVKNGTNTRKISANRDLLVFVGLWLLTFALYLPAAKAGWVRDAVGWLNNIRNLPFADYINNTQSAIPSLYQFTQFTTYLVYKVVNANPYAWHLLMVTMHVVNCYLFYLLCATLFTDAGLKNGRSIALAGVCLYTVCPHISEVIVWEPAFHYLQGFLLILLILRWQQLFIHNPLKKYAWWAGIVYLCSTYSLEIFYLTPWFSVAMLLYYRFGLRYDRETIRKAFRYFVIPQLLLFLVHIILLKVVYSYLFAHIGPNFWQPFTNYICKPPRYLFHILFMGRFFSFDTRKAVYDMIGSTPGLIIFYNAFILLCLHVGSRFSGMSSRGKIAALLFAWIIPATAIILPLAFPDMLLVYFDRYTYFLDAFVYMLLAIGISYIPGKYISGAVLAAIGAAHVYFTIIINLTWKHSNYITTRLLKEMPDPTGKTVVILNLPQNMNGVPMIGAEQDGQFKKMHDMLVAPGNYKIYDAAAYNMLTKEDGAHVLVVNDSTVKVTLNQWGTWWWYGDFGGISYENEDYKLNMVDMGHWYLLTLKKPKENFLLLFEVGDQWRTVDWNRKNEEQY